VLITNVDYPETTLLIADSELGEYWTTWGIDYRGVYGAAKAYIFFLAAIGGVRLQCTVHPSGRGAGGVGLEYAEGSAC